NAAVYATTPYPKCFFIRGKIDMKFYPAMLREIKKHINENDTIIIGVSGGPDSMALFKLLVSISKKYNLKLIAAHFNHMLRGTESKRDMEFVKKEAKKAGVEFVCRERNINVLNKKTGFGTEKTAREERYKFFIETAVKYKAEKIALAHNMDDNAETILFRLIKGTGTKGLCGIPAKRKLAEGEFGIKTGKDIFIVRPLLGFSKKQIMLLLKELKQRYVTDSSNRESVYQRNIIRNKLIPLVEKEMNPKIKECLVRNTEIAAAEEGFISEEAQKYIRENAEIKGESAVFLWSPFILLHPALRQRVLMALFQKILRSKRKVDFALVSEADCAILRNKNISLPSGFALKTVNGEIHIFKCKNEKPESEEDVSIAKPGKKTAFGGFVFETKIVKNEPGIDFKEQYKAYLDLSKIVFPLTIRRRRSGDRFMPFGMKSQVKIKDFIISQKIKNEIILVCDEKQIIWAAGIRADERAKVDERSKKLLLMRFYPLK
ncbi:MAG TPA: tRNA lysidine(34) synthetase TilS, partial [Candidatus Goldiibacteriota bacterium]|nr:tRNA lysidine(34) synthetase TilS [Candidatus Goldiibacteriota bacterium]